ncbi:MAG: helix-turn-helix domain-containing protein [Rhodospirillaceae bacterium]|jgi:putative transcriptional regulator|nr:helix-turn-helix domain-containing protein [Rhodospirillaceae bacterium]MBT4487992.1 helix-turn-helix domain-containing protein [Rhodospirillaceae bacterium]MBT5192885.1 helix-turn-helix domain-containing protein [Rhodospirillaceae bacterium]MBT5894754.1 helix-turn-helix domain-containing protein [Rhodospirillaceae bacterium]MBT6426330.1 helix-turn-helix domain-containing protein [Rhodospirillaceae bacterium]
MSENTTSGTVVNFDARPRLSKDERARLENMSDDEIRRAAQDDPDNRELTDAELAEFKPVADAKLIRQSMGLTQEDFARKFQIPIGTLRDWEQHRTEPDKAAQNFLKVVSVTPETVVQALSILHEPAE